MFKQILSVPTEELGRWTRYAVLQLKLWRHCARLLRQNRAGTQAAALSYHTLFGIVPLAIVMVMVFQAIPAYRDVGEKVRKLFYEQMNLSQIMYPAEEESGQGEIKLTDKIDEITDKYISRLNAGAITLFSSAIIIWAAVGLLTTIERSFNSIWHIGRGRTFVQRIVNYWTLMTLGPLLLVLGFYVSTHYLVTDGTENRIANLIRPLLPYIISVAALFLLYFVLPNTRVSIRAAIWGSAVAALIWTGAKILFTMYMAKFQPYKGVYGAISIIPLSVFWIWVTWVIVLFGLQLTYTTQHLKSLNAAEIAATRKVEEHFLVSDFTIIKILEYIHEQFQNKKGPASAEDICSRMNLPAEFGAKVLDHLVAKGLLVQTAEPQNGYMPGTDSEKTTLADIADAVKGASFDQNFQAIPARLRQVMDRQRQQLADVTLKDVLEEDSA